MSFFMFLLGLLAGVLLAGLNPGLAKSLIDSIKHLFGKG